MEQDQEEVKLRKSERGRISRRRFEIEGDPGNLILSPKTTTPSVGKRTCPILEIETNGTRQSTPYHQVVRAIQNYDIVF